MPAKLSIHVPTQAVAIHVLDDGAALTLGRAPENDCVLAHDSVSRRHARVVVAGETATLEDLDSKNGTFLRGRRIKGSMPLVPGDDIKLGSVPLKLKLLAEPGSTATQSRRRR